MRQRAGTAMGMAAVGLLLASACGGKVGEDTETIVLGTPGRDDDAGAGDDASGDDASSSDATTGSDVTMLPLPPVPADGGDALDDSDCATRPWNECSDGGEGADQAFADIVDQCSGSCGHPPAIATFDADGCATSVQVGASSSKVAACIRDILSRERLRCAKSTAAYAPGPCTK